MSEENMEVVRRVWEAWLQGDRETVFSHYDPGMEMIPRTGPGTFLSGVYRGHEGMKRFFREWREPFEDYQVDVEEFLDAGGDHVLVNTIQRGRGRGSGIQVEQSIWFLYTLRGGRVIRIEGYDTKDEALEAAGLSE